ncbi:hypothetical protein CK489_26850 [Bradyrhizobium sp. UFLA03-84]|nr:hypothetical protein CK489_26850 [Bradyrhizobium sp. UFLA03-84]
MAHCADAYAARHLVNGMGNILSLTPFAVPFFAADLIDAKNRDDVWGAAKAAAGMVPGGGAGKQLAIDIESRMARASEMGFRTETPLYHGTGRTFDAIKSVPTDAPGQVLPGVSLSLNPEIASEFALRAPDRGLGEYPQVYKLLHRRRIRQL